MFKVGTLDALGDQLRPWQHGQPLLRDLDGCKSPAGFIQSLKSRQPDSGCMFCLKAGLCTYRGFHR